MSRLPFELLLALRYLRPKRTFVSIITLISILGVALGVAVLIIVISVMSGFDHDLRAKILGFNAHLRIVASGQTMDNYDAVMDLVSSNKNVIGRGAVCPRPGAHGNGTDQRSATAVLRRAVCAGRGSRPRKLGERAAPKHHRRQI